MLERKTMKIKVFMGAIALFAVVSSPLMAASFSIVDGGALGADIAYNSSRDATYTLGQTQAGESCVEMDLTADDAYIRFDGGSGIEWSKNESLLTIEMLVTSQTPLTPDQGLTRLQMTMEGGSDPDVNLSFRGFDWFPTTTNTWVTFTADFSTDSDVSGWDSLIDGKDDYYPRRIYFYNDNQMSGTTFYTKNISFTAPTPEPATMGLLSLGGLALLRRRKK